MLERHGSLASSGQAEDPPLQNRRQNSKNGKALALTLRFLGTRSQRYLYEFGSGAVGGAGLSGSGLALQERAHGIQGGDIRVVRRVSDVAVGADERDARMAGRSQFDDTRTRVAEAFGRIGN